MFKISAHARFITSQAEGAHFYHFVSNRTLPIENKFNFRVVPEDSVEIFFSKSKNLQHGAVTIILKGAQTEVKSDGVNFNYLKQEYYQLKAKEINDIEILFTETEISIQNKITVEGQFSDLNFIGFNSIAAASWVVQKSKM